MKENSYLELMGKKLGMTQIFTEDGKLIPCSVLLIKDHMVTGICTKEKEGYNAVQIGYDNQAHLKEKTLEARMLNPVLGQFRKKNLPVFRHLYESRIDSPQSYNVGQEISLEQLNGLSFVDVIGTSKGKGYQGAMKLHNFAGGPAAHGSGFHRKLGSTGMRSTPGRALPGGKRASHMGDERVTVHNLKVIKVDLERNLLVIEGAVPGHEGGWVRIRKAVKKK